MSLKPIIAVTGPQKGGLAPWLMTWLAITRAGGKAVRVTPADRHKLDLQNGEKGLFDGLIIGGGSDIHPSHYGEELSEFNNTTRNNSLKDRIIFLLLFLLRMLFSIKLTQPASDPNRDELELALCRLAITNNLPVLGICRGAQLLNVAFGGTLFQDTRDLYTETPHIRSLRPFKSILLEPSSHLANILNVQQLKVNALHNQAVNRLGEGLQVCARDLNGIVQAIESSEAEFIIGVQWHPEYLPQEKSQKTLFKALVNRAERTTR